jgi:sigma-B regulation protein RsbU (phosphoserine phosphatase)
LSDIDALERELRQLKKEKAAFQAQCDLFQDFISMARSPEEPEFVKATLRKIVEVSAELTGADMGSLFLLDTDGVVVDSILARGQVAPEVGSVLIGSVFKKGLAGWVFHHRKIGLVTDTTKDERWLNLPDQPYSIRSALALPIISGEMVLGILTLMHSMPAHFQPETTELMKLTANQLALVLENAYLFANLADSFKSLGIAKKEIEVYSRALEKELESGHRIQKDFLPRQLPSYPNWGIEAYFHPARQVSGDFYDLFELPGGYAGLVVGDVCDKGVGSALFMALFRSLFRIFSGHARLHAATADRPVNGRGGGFDSAAIRFDAAAVLNTVDLTNDYIAREHSELCMFATIFFGVLDPANGKLVYVNAGHEPVVVIRRQGLPECLDQTGPAVGLVAQPGFTCKALQLHPGDLLFAYTDGVTNARSPADELFSRDRLISLLTHPAGSETELVEKIKTALTAHIGPAPPEDDITILTLQRKPSA